MSHRCILKRRPASTPQESCCLSARNTTFSVFALFCNNPCYLSCDKINSNNSHPVLSLSVLLVRGTTQPRILLYFNFAAPHTRFSTADCVTLRNKPIQPRPRVHAQTLCKENFTTQELPVDRGPWPRVSRVVENSYYNEAKSAVLRLTSAPAPSWLQNSIRRGSCLQILVSLWLYIYMNYSQ